MAATDVFYRPSERAHARPPWWVDLVFGGGLAGSGISTAIVLRSPVAAVPFVAASIHCFDVAHRQKSAVAQLALAVAACACARRGRRTPD
jgi:hypothetical protein